MPAQLLKMRASTFSSVFFTLLGFVAADEKLSYDGYKVYRVKTGKALEIVQSKLKAFDFEQWNHDSTSHIDVVIPARETASFEALGLDFRVMHANLGDSIAAESAPITANTRRQAGNLTWYDSYHPYADHIRYFEDLQAGFPNNSKIISSGKSYEGRDIYGLHLWGSGGPGKPAVLYHATVHAREWIAAPVSRNRQFNLQSTHLIFLGGGIYHLPACNRVPIPRPHRPHFPRLLRLLHPTFRQS